MHQTALQASTIENIICTLAQRDYCIIPGAFEPSFCARLRAEMATLPLRPSAIGRGDQQVIREDIRNDKTHWLSQTSAAQNAYLQSMDELRLALNERFFLGLSDFEAHYARYDAGGFYRRHFDSFANLCAGQSGQRRVSTVCYLNQTWSEHDGGALQLYENDNDKMGHAVLPETGKLVVFISQTIAHEVKPAVKERLSIAGWFRIRELAR